MGSGSKLWQLDESHLHHYFHGPADPACPLSLSPGCLSAPVPRCVAVPCSWPPHLLDLHPSCHGAKLEVGVSTHTTALLLPCSCSQQVKKRMVLLLHMQQAAAVPRKAGLWGRGSSSNEDEEEKAVWAPKIPLLDANRSCPGGWSGCRAVSSKQPACLHLARGMGPGAMLQPEPALTESHVPGACQAEPR